MEKRIVDFARKRKADKRGGDQTKISLNEGIEIFNEYNDKILEIDDALKKLAEVDDRLSKVVELRFFAGLNVEETATVLDCSPSTVKREWSLAKAWLFRELG